VVIFPLTGVYQQTWGQSTECGGVTQPSGMNVVKCPPWNAVGDGKADDTQPLRAALADAAAKGRQVFLPPGLYRLTGQLVIPKGVGLYGAGSPATPRWHYGAPGTWQTRLNKGSTLAIAWGKTLTSSADAAVVMNSQTTIDGVNFWYPEQPGNTTTPAVFPPTVALARGGDPEEARGYLIKPTIRNVVFVNPWTAMDFTEPHTLLTVERVAFTAWSVGLRIDGSVDVDRIIDVHSNPTLTYYGLYGGENIHQYQHSQPMSAGILIGQADQLYMSRIFVYGFTNGLLFADLGRGGANGVIIEQSGFEGSLYPLRMISPFTRIVIHGCLFGAERTAISADLPATGATNELRISDSTVWAARHSGLWFNNVIDATITNTHFYQTESETSAGPEASIYVKNSRGISFRDITVQAGVPAGLDAAGNPNAIYWSVVDSQGISIEGAKFMGSRFDGSTATITGSKGVRVGPRYFYGHDPKTEIYQVGNENVVIDPDVVVYDTPSSTTPPPRPPKLLPSCSATGYKCCEPEDSSCRLCVPSNASCP
jgi:hypothetical protein